MKSFCMFISNAYEEEGEEGDNYPKRGMQRRGQLFETWSNERLDKVSLREGLVR